MFKVFVGRDETRALRGDQLERFQGAGRQDRAPPSPAYRSAAVSPGAATCSEQSAGSVMPLADGAAGAAALPGRGVRRHRQRAAAAQSVAVGHVRECRHRGAGGHGRAGLGLAGHLDGMAGQDHRDQPHDSDRQAEARPAGDRARAGRCRAGQPRRPRRRRADHPVRGARGRACRTACRRRLQGADRAAAGAGRGRDVAPDRARHRRARHHRRHRTLRRPVRHGLGHHECLHRHLRGAHHQSRGGRARHRRSAAGDRARPGRGDPGGRDLQSPRAHDRGLSRAARRRLGAGDAADQPRRRPRLFRLARAAE